MHICLSLARAAFSALLLIAAAGTFTGCGSDGRDSDDARSRARVRNNDRAITTVSAPSPTSTTVSTAATTCLPPRAITPTPTPTTGLVAATRALAAATNRASAVRRPFMTDITITLTSGVRVRARLTGARLANGASSATLRWQGAARLVLPDQRLRIVSNQLAARDLRPRAQWQPLGSASGIALDVGRELFTHPFLLDVTGAARAGELHTVRSVARAADLRAYATTERQGRATELLARIPHGFGFGRRDGCRVRVVSIGRLVGRSTMRWTGFWAGMPRCRTVCVSVGWVT